VLKYIAVTDLCVGMYIQELSGSEADCPFWKHSFLLEDEHALAKIRASSIAGLWIDSSRGVEATAVPQETFCAPAAGLPEHDSDLAPSSAVPRPRPRVAMSEELLRAVNLCSRSKKAVMAMFADLRMGRVVHLDRITDMVGEISDSLLRHPDALINLVRLKDADEYTYMHSVAVCGLMIGLARQLGLPTVLVQEAGLAGLLHDIGKMAIPAAILGKPSALSENEYTTMCSHPESGAKMLRDSKHFSSRVLDVCLHHHEKVDGSGYPHKLCGTQISLFARMAAICDVYDALTSDRPYRDRWGAAEWRSGPGISIRKYFTPSSNALAFTRLALWYAFKAAGLRWFWNSMPNRCSRPRSRSSIRRHGVCRWSRSVSTCPVQRTGWSVSSPRKPGASRTWKCFGRM